MPDKETAHFFDLLDAHSLSPLPFYRSQEARQWYAAMRSAARLIPAENWRIYALNVVDELQSAADNQDAVAINRVVMNAFSNQMYLIWA